MSFSNCRKIASSAAHGVWSRILRSKSEETLPEDHVLPLQHWSGGSLQEDRSGIRDLLHNLWANNMLKVCRRIRKKSVYERGRTYNRLWKESCWEAIVETHTGKTWGKDGCWNLWTFQDDTDGNLFQATNICCGQEQLKNRKITAFPDSRQLLNTNKKRSASSCLLRPKDAKMPQAKLKTTAAAMTDCYKHWKKVKSQGFLLY